MRLADYVVTFSLQINNRCLRYLADTDTHASLMGALPGIDLEHKALSQESQPVYTESLLVRDSRRLASMWSLMQPALVEHSVLRSHIEQFQVAAERLAQDSATRRIALRLAGSAADDEDAQAMLQIARALPVQAPFGWEQLNDVFTHDSTAWRSSDQFRYVSDAVLCQRIARSYRKAYRQHEAYRGEQSHAWLADHGAAWYRWVQLAAHQLELLRPGLSDKGKAQLWYLSKLADTLRMREGLLALSGQIGQLELRKAVVKSGSGYVEAQMNKMDKRLQRLNQGCFGAKPKKVLVNIELALGALGLTEVRTMQPRGETRRRDGGQIDASTKKNKTTDGDSSESVYG